MNTITICWRALLLSGTMVALCLGTAACESSNDSAETDTQSLPDGANSANDTWEDEGTDTTLPEDSPSEATGDDQPPAFEDLRVTVSGEFAQEVRLNSQDAELILPVEAEAVVTVFALDDVSQPEAFVVTIVDADSGEAAADQAPSFRNGLWRVSLTLQAGERLRVSVIDEAGNEALSPHQLILPLPIEALPGSWEQCFFDENLTITTCWLAQFEVDGTWSSVDDESGATRAGSYEQDGDGLRVFQRTHSTGDGQDGDSDEQTVEWEQAASFYVDATYLSLLPFDQVSAGEGIIGGEWQRTYELLEQGEATQRVQVTEELSFSSERFISSVTRTPIDAPGTSQTTVSEGSYTVRLNESYIDNFGDFVVRTTDTIDGTPVEDASSVTELFIIRASRLLISPYLAVR